jgi:16S rRNA C1402 (ribose-2'-O) methylase RsmI
LQTVAQSGYPCVLYASPHELKAPFEVDFRTASPQRALSISKELTENQHEKTVRGTAAECMNHAKKKTRGNLRWSYLPVRISIRMPGRIPTMNSVNSI